MQMRRLCVSLPGVTQTSSVRSHLICGALQVFCSKQQPRCGTCPLQGMCEYALHNGPRMPSPTMQHTAGVTSVPLADGMPAATSAAVRGGAVQDQHQDGVTAAGQPDADMENAVQVPGREARVTHCFVYFDRGRS